MPRHLRSAEWAERWDDVDQVVRADLIGYVDEPAVGTGLVLDHPVDLPDTWWAGLRAGLDALRRVTGDGAPGAASPRTTRGSIVLARSASRSTSAASTGRWPTATCTSGGTSPARA